MRVSYVENWFNRKYLNESLFESKEDILKFVDLFGLDNYDKFVKLKDRIKKIGSTDLIYHVNHTKKSDLETLIKY